MRLKVLWSNESTWFLDKCNSSDFVKLLNVEGSSDVSWLLDNYKDSKFFKLLNLIGSSEESLFLALDEFAHSKDKISVKHSFV